MLQRQVASAAQAAQDLQLRAAAESKDLHVLAGSIQVPKRFRNASETLPKLREFGFALAGDFDRNQDIEKKTRDQNS